MASVNSRHKVGLFASLIHSFRFLNFNSPPQGRVLSGQVGHFSTIYQRSPLQLIGLIRVHFTRTTRHSLIMPGIKRKLANSEANSPARSAGYNTALAQCRSDDVHLQCDIRRDFEGGCVASCSCVQCRRRTSYWRVSQTAGHKTFVDDRQAQKISPSPLMVSH